MKINWGYRIVILYVGFVGLIVYMVNKSMHQNIDLVATDYYAQELKYEDKLDKMRRNNEMSEQICISTNLSTVEVSFPAQFRNKKIEGQIHLQRPSDVNKDMTYPIQADSDMKQVLSTKHLFKGLYHIQVDYVVDGKGYYMENELVIK